MTSNPLRKRSHPVAPVTSVVVLMVAALAAGCGTPTGPSTAPTAVQPSATSLSAPTPAQPAQSASQATVAVSSFDVAFSEQTSTHSFYRWTMALKETGGKSAARITGLWFSLGGADLFVRITVDGPIGTGCLTTEESRVIPAGGTWTTDMAYRYCLVLDDPLDVRGGQAVFSMDYVDDAGRSGTVSGSTTIR